MTNSARMPVPTLGPAGLDRLACPVCHRPLALDADTVRCNACGWRYPIEDGIAVLLAERAS